MSRITPLDYASLPHEAYRVAPEKMLAGSPEQAVRNAFSDPSGRFHVGFWEAQPGKWRVAYTEHEYCEILEGVSVLRDEQGQSKTLRAGDRFVIPAGFVGTWEVLERCRKVYVMFEATR